MKQKKTTRWVCFNDPAWESSGWGRVGYLNPARWGWIKNKFRKSSISRCSNFVQIIITLLSELEDAVNRLTMNYLDFIPAHCIVQSQFIIYKIETGFSPQHQCVLYSYFKILTIINYYVLAYEKNTQKVVYSTQAL